MLFIFRFNLALIEFFKSKLNTCHDYMEILTLNVQHFIPEVGYKKTLKNIYLEVGTTRRALEENI